MKTFKKIFHSIMGFIAVIIVVGEPEPGSFFDNMFVMIFSKLLALTYLALLGLAANFEEDEKDNKNN